MLDNSDGLSKEINITVSEKKVWSNFDIKSFFNHKSKTDRACHIISWIVSIFVLVTAHVGMYRKDTTVIQYYPQLQTLEIDLFKHETH